MGNLFYRNTRLLILTVILIFVWGLSSFQLLPRLEDPELTNRVATVTTLFPGADAARVESLVTEKIESELQEIEEIQTLTSTSRAGISLVTIELLDEITQVDEIWSRTRDKLNGVSVELPPGTTEPEFEEANLKAYAMILALTWEQDNQPNYAILRRRAELLQDALRSIPGTEEVELRGDPQEEIVVEVNPAELTKLGITAQNLAQQIQQSDAKVASGQLRNSNNELLIEVETELDSLSRVRQIPLSFGSEGQFTRLGDIATVSKGIKEPPDDLAIVDGYRAIALTVLVRSSQRLDQWADSAYQAITEFEQQLPSGLGLQIIFDQTLYVESRLDSLIFNLFLGALLVFAVVLVMMGWQSAVIVGSALPLAGLMVLGSMALLGIPLHQMSITGLIVALGLLIDNAIVVVDEVNNRLGEGLLPGKAIKESVNYLKIPLLSSTLTTILAFLPIALLSGGTGEFVSTIGINVIIALISSLLLSLTIIPALTALLSKKQTSRLSHGITIPWLTRMYGRTLRYLFAKPAMGVILALIIPVIGFSQFATLGEQFFPPADRNQFNIELELPSTTSIAKTQSVTLAARSLILQHQEVEQVHWFVGRSAPKFYYNLIEGRKNQANYAQAMVETNSSEAALSLIPSLQTELDNAFPEARILVRQLEQGPPFDAPVEMRIYGSDVEKLRQLGTQLRAELAQVNHVTHVRDSLSESTPKLAWQVDEEETRLAGLDNATIARQLNTTLEGSNGGSIVESTEELAVRVRLSNQNRGDLNQISSLDLLGNRSNSTIPLSALGKIKLVPEQDAIARRNGARVNTIQGYIETGVLPAQVLAEFEQRLEDSDFQLPLGYSLEIGGEAEERNNAVGSLISLVGVLTIIMVATLVLSLGSFRLAGTIGVVAVSSIGLGLFSLKVFGYPFGFMAIIGTIGLVGVAINDSIVVLAAIKEDEKAKLGDRRAMETVVLHSTRHVIATTLTTMIGFVPLLLGGGGFWPPLAVSIAGGIGGATLLALYFIPCAYLLLRSH